MAHNNGNEIYAECFICKNIFMGKETKEKLRPITINNTGKVRFICDACYNALTTHKKFSGIMVDRRPVVNNNVFVKRVTDQSKFSAHVTLSKNVVAGRKRAVVILLDGKDE